MKSKPATTKNGRKGKPLEIVKVSNVSIPIYVHSNIIPQRDGRGEIIYGQVDEGGKRRALVKYRSDIYTVAYYEGSKRVRLKFSDLEKARREAELAAIKLSNGELEALKLRGHDRSDYVRAMQKLREWRPDLDLNFAISDYIGAVRRLPENTGLKEAVDFYLVIAAFCGLRSAEIARLDWSEVHLTGAERFIEVKAAKAKTASRRTVPILENCAAWLAPFSRESGPVCPFERPDKQCFNYVGPTAKVDWKRNGLRRSFISYRLAQIKNVHQVSLEAGNSPQMVFAHYRQLVTETQAAEWFGIVPANDWKNITPMPTEITNGQPPATDTHIVANG